MKWRLLIDPLQYLVYNDAISTDTIALRRGAVWSHPFLSGNRESQVQ